MRAIARNTCLAILSCWLLAACMPVQTTPALPVTAPLPVPASSTGAASPTVKSPAVEQAAPQASGNAPASLSQISSQAILALAERDFRSLAALVHPELGLRFSPYANIAAQDQVFTPTQLAAILADSRIFHWGSYDGSGEPIDLSFEGYYQRFIYDVDFARPEKIGYGHSFNSGSTIDNHADFYPGATLVDYYFSGFDPQYSGMDWRSLRLVFMPVGLDWKLVGIIHAEWGP